MKHACVSLAARPALLPASIDVRLLVVGDANLADQLDLRFQPVDVVFLRSKDLAQQIAADIVAGDFAVGDRRPEGRGVR